MAFYNNNLYLQDLKNMRDRIDSQLQQYQNQPVPNVTQNFQLAPQSELEAKFVDNIDNVKNTFVMKTGLFVNKDYTTLWIKDVSGNIKTYKLEEVVELDDKDKMIVELQKQINELKEAMYDTTNADIDETTTKQKSAKLSTSAKSTTK